MRDDSKKWTPPVSGPVHLTRPGATLQQITPKRQTLVSGVDALDAFTAELGPATGWPDIAAGPGYAAALRRDRVLLVNGPVQEDGWTDTRGLAVSDMTGGYAIFELTGPRVMDVLKRGTEIDLQEPSRSAARLFAGLGVILYMYETAETVRLHVNRAQAQTLVQTIEAYFNQMS